MAFKTMAASSTVRTIGPGWSIDHANGVSPYLLISPYVGFRPTIPQRDAGILTDPPVSLPMVTVHCPEAVADPDPPLEPPA